MGTQGPHDLYCCSSGGVPSGMDQHMGHMHMLMLMH